LSIKVPGTWTADYQFDASKMAEKRINAKGWMQIVR
jgi:hypothetical protein